MPKQVPFPGDGGGGSSSEVPNTQDKSDKEGKEPRNDDGTRTDRNQELDSGDSGRNNRATECGPGIDELANPLRDVFRRAKEEGLSRETLKESLNDFFAHELGQQKITEADRKAIYDLIFERLDSGVRCADWFGMDELPTMKDSAAGAHGERFIGQFLRGMVDSAEKYIDMHFSNVIGQDHFYHCMAHCESSSRGPGGQLASKLVGYARESTDALKNSTREGSARHAVLDSFVDSYVNRIGYEGGRSGTRCNVQCARLKPNGMP
jgi:Serum amyloid A protein